MSLIRWQPRSDLSIDPFFDRLDRQVSEMFGDWPFERTAQRWYPAMDMVEEKDRLVLRLELPGIDPKDVEINLQGNLLTIQGERKEESELKEGTILKRERRIGSFQRTLQLPYGVQSDKVKATYDKGVMTINLPKVEAQVGRQIPVEAK
jgi:HSP20 family protein